MSIRTMTKTEKQMTNNLLNSTAMLEGDIAAAYGSLTVGHPEYFAMLSHIYVRQCRVLRTMSRDIDRLIPIDRDSDIHGTNDEWAKYAHA